MRVTEFICFINEKKMPEPIDMKVYYPHLTLDAKIKIYRKEYRRELRKNAKQESKTEKDGKEKKT